MDTSLSIRKESPAEANFLLVFKSLFNEEFLPYEALEDVCALHRLLFQSPLVLTVEDIVNKSNVKPASFAFEDMVFLNERFQHLQTFRDKRSFHGVIRARSKYASTHFTALMWHEKQTKKENSKPNL